MTPRYLTVKDVMAIMQCKRTTAYALIAKIGKANTGGMARVLESKFYEYLESRDRCVSTDGESETANGSGGQRGQKTEGRSGGALAAPRKPPRRSSSQGGSESAPIPFTPRRKVQPSESKRAGS